MLPNTLGERDVTYIKPNHPFSWFDMGLPAHAHQHILTVTQALPHRGRRAPTTVVLSVIVPSGPPAFTTSSSDTKL